MVVSEAVDGGLYYSYLAFQVEIGGAFQTLFESMASRCCCPPSTDPQQKMELARETILFPNPLPTRASQCTIA